MTLGLQPYDRPNGVFPLADCHITDHRLMELWRELRQRLELLPPRLAKVALRLDRDGRRPLNPETAGRAGVDGDPPPGRRPPGHRRARRGYSGEVGSAVVACPGGP